MFTTRQTLLDKVRLGQNPGWDDFERLYKPLIYLRGKDRGLANHELDDLAQQVFLNLYQKDSVEKYKAERGRFRDYLRTIIDRRAYDLLRKRKAKTDNLEDLSTQEIEPDLSQQTDMELHWEQEWQYHLYQQALEIIRPEVSKKTLDAFLLCIENQLTIEQISTQLNISTDSVYVAKHRVLKRISPVIRQLESTL